MKKLLAALLLTIIAFPALAADRESVYDRVIQSGKIRCGYFSYPPVLMKDPNTGEFSGIFYDYMNELGKALSLKVEWTEEIGLGDFPAALEAGRIDAMCAGIWLTAQRARVNDFVMPVYYLPLYAYAREDDTRFDKDINIVNDSQYTMAILEGGATSMIQKQLFPNVKVYELPQLTSPAELFTSLAAGKADMVIYDLFTYGNYNANNPGKVQKISSQAVKVYPNAITLRHGEDKFRQMLSNATLEMHLSGAIEKILKKHEKYPGALLNVAKPYELPEQ